MSRRGGPFRRLLLLPALVVVILSGIWVAGPVTAEGATPAATKLWVSRYNGPGNGLDHPTAAAVSPDGSHVYVTGYSPGSTSSFDYATMAYDSLTGAKQWVKRYNGPGNGEDRALALAVSPDGSLVFVTGFSFGTASKFYVTLAYDAATGAERWKRRSSPGNSPAALAVSPDGSQVFVTGSAACFCRYSDYATVAYDAATGAKQWTRRYDGPGNDGDSATDVAVSPDGSEVFVTGSSFGSSGFPDYATLAYDARTGAKRWLARYDGPGDASVDAPDSATAVAVSPDGSQVFVTGNSRGVVGAEDFATLAYDASTGIQRWVKRFNGPGGTTDYATAVAVSPLGSEVFVTGGVYTYPTGFEYATLAYDAATGAKQWVRIYGGPAGGGSFAYAMGSSPDGSQVFVTGVSFGATSSGDYATLSYDAATGTKQWAKRYNGPGNGNDYATALAVSPDGDRLFVTGWSVGSTSSADFATVAYSAS